MNFRVGIGYDVHRLKKRRKLVLGGIEIPYKYGLEGHSDADVILHSIADAVLGACGSEDIGKHFPDTDPRYKNISSKIILKKVKQIASRKKYRVVNVDSTIILEKPKISPYRRKMQKCIRSILSGTLSQVNIKATTNEKMGFIGKGEGIACFSVVLLSSRYP